MQYCASSFHAQRRAAREVRVGSVGIGGSNPIRVQSMITCDTMDTAASIQQTLDLAAVAREAVESLAEPARREAGVTILCNAPRVPLPAIGDRPRLVQVAQNLLRNAIRHTPEGGLIMVEAALGDPHTTILRVTDTGEGIPPEHLPHVFERFYRADAARTRASGGAGLGLAIARELVEAMGGAIIVTSPAGEGASFTIRLPAAP